MKRTLFWSMKSKSDFAGIVRYVAAEDGSAALLVRDYILRAVLSLGEIPTGRPGRVTGTYEKSVAGAPYIVAYKIEAQPTGEERVVIVRVIHQARDWPGQNWPEG